MNNIVWRGVFNVMIEKIEELKRMVRFNAFGGTDYEKDALLSELERAQLKFEELRDKYEE
jgi:hypothetical protein